MLMKYLVQLKKYLFFTSLFMTFVVGSYDFSHARSYAKLLINSSGKVLYDENADQEMYPASITKLATLYLVFEALKNNKISFDTSLSISKKAAAMPRSSIGLKHWHTITVEEAILSLIVSSANDSAVVLAENLAGTEAAFAYRMNQKAKQLGMKKTNFTNASGWHHPQQKTTAYDLAKLAIALKRDFPEYYHLFSRTSFSYRNTVFRGHNHVLNNLRGAQGLKTGYTSKAGWNIVTAAKRGGTALIGIILGGKSYKSRDAEMINMMNTYFNKKTLYTSLNNKKANLG